MFRLTHRNAIILSGITWLFMGAFLLYKGLQYLVLARQAFFIKSHQGFSLIANFESLVGDKKGPVLLMSLAFILGMIKGRFALRKTAERVILHIRKLPTPCSFKELYPKGYFILLGSMMALGISFKFLPIPLDIKGFVDLTVGVALMSGAMRYFRESFSPRIDYL